MSINDAQVTPREPRRPSRSAVIIAGKRRTQITAILRDVCDGPCRTDDAILWLDEVLPHLRIASSPKAYAFARDEWVRLNTPGLTPADVEAAEARILPNPPPFTSARIGARLGLTIEQYERLGLTHVKPRGWTKRKAEARTRKRKADAVRAKRLATGETKTPRELSVERLAPWNGLGISRATFKRLARDVQVDHVAQAREAVR